MPGCLVVGLGDKESKTSSSTQHGRKPRSNDKSDKSRGGNTAMCFRERKVDANRISQKR